MTPAESVAVPARALRPSDVRGLTQLGFNAALGITNLVEAMHHTIVSGSGIVGKAPSGRTSGITGFVYGTVRGTTRLVGRGLDAALGAVMPPAAPQPLSPAREVALAVLNGVWGDHLAASNNPLAIQASLRIGGQPLELASADLAARLAQPSGKLLVLAHGLCMNDLQWTRNGHDHGQALARDLGFTPVYLHYNSGRHVSESGQDFAELLEKLIAQWPVPVDELVVVGHSMGGLVTRSAHHHAVQMKHRWTAALTKLVFLGTPHHGAALERGGHQVDMLFGISPYVAPFSRLGKARSAGITDLRFGNLQPADWQGRDRHSQRHDDRQPTPLPKGVDAFIVAASKATKVGGLHSRVIGDGLVPLASALGEHRESQHALKVPPHRTRIVTSADHWDLLDREDVYAQLRAWLS
jgi:pimeloyl-ACP methyl ester carboxylesterase